MAINFGGYKNLGWQTQESMQNFGNQMSNAWKGQGPMKGLLGKMTDDEGLFQGGEKNRLFGRLRDRFEGQGTSQGNVDNNDTGMSDMSGNYQSYEGESIEDNSLLGSVNGIKTNEAYDNPNSAFALNNSSWGGGSNWMDGNNNAEYNQNSLSDIDQYAVSGRGSNWMNGNNSEDEELDEFGQPVNSASNWMDNNGMNWMNNGQYTGDSIESNPSVIDKSLNQTGGQGWNSGGGGNNWRQGY